MRTFDTYIRDSDMAGPPNAETFLGPCFAILCIAFMWALNFACAIPYLPYRSLYGLFYAQIYYYYTTYHDRLALRLAVLLLWWVLLQDAHFCVLRYSISILETVHVAASIHMLYMYLVVDYANPSSLTNILWWVHELISFASTDA